MWLKVFARRYSKHHYNSQLVPTWRILFTRTAFLWEVLVRELVSRSKIIRVCGTWDQSRPKLGCFFPSNPDVMLLDTCKQFYLNIFKTPWDTTKPMHHILLSLLHKKVSGYSIWVKILSKFVFIILVNLMKMLININNFILHIQKQLCASYIYLIHLQWRNLKFLQHRFSLVGNISLTLVKSKCKEHMPLKHDMRL